MLQLLACTDLATADTKLNRGQDACIRKIGYLALPRIITGFCIIFALHTSKSLAFHIWKLISFVYITLETVMKFNVM